MTAAVCISYCSSKGYKYAGTQYMTQCYCGNTFTANSVSGCDSVCAGDRNQICGGAYKSTVYTSVAASKRSLEEKVVFEGGVVEKMLLWVPEVPDSASDFVKRSADQASGAIERIMDWTPWTSRPDGVSEVVVGGAEGDGDFVKRSTEEATWDESLVEPIEEWYPWSQRMADEKAKESKGETEEVARLRRRHRARPRGRDLDRRY